MMIFNHEKSKNKSQLCFLEIGIGNHIGKKVQCWPFKIKVSLVNQVFGVCGKIINPHTNARAANL